MILKTSVSLPKSQHDRLKKLADQLGVPLETLTAAAVGDWLDRGTWKTWLTERAQKLIAQEEAA